MTANVRINLPPGLHPFVRLVLGDLAVQAELGAVLEAQAFVAAAGAVAARHGVALDPGELDAVLRPDPLGLGRFGAAPLELDGWPPLGWLPAYGTQTEGAPVFDWLWLGSQPLTRPFYEDEMRRAGALPLNWLMRVRAGLKALVTGAVCEPGLPLGGLIYHMSRCGSTLLAQLLAAVPGHVVSSEPAPLDAVVQWAARPEVPEDQAIAALRAVVAALGRRRDPAMARHFIKTDAWHTLSLPLLRAAFPESNWVHLFRDANEVMASFIELPGAHVVPGMLPEALLGFAAEAGQSREDFAARVAARYGEAVLDGWAGGGGMIVRYPDIAKDLQGRLGAHFGIALCAETLAALGQAGSRDAKAPDQKFSSDAERKRKVLTPAAALAAQWWMYPVENRLAQLIEQ